MEEQTFDCTILDKKGKYFFDRPQLGTKEVGDRVSKDLGEIFLKDFRIEIRNLRVSERIQIKSQKENSIGKDGSYDWYYRSNREIRIYVANLVDGRNHWSSSTSPERARSIRQIRKIVYTQSG